MNKLDFLNCLEQIPKVNCFGERVTVVGATKTVPAQTVNLAIECGLENVGENKAVEFFNKLPDLSPCTLHFIGHLQTNKIKYVVGKCHLIQSVDSERLLNCICEQAKRLAITQDILLEVNVGNEPQKHGFLKEQLLDVFERYKSCPQIKIRGLMTVLPNYANKTELIPLCLQMRNLYDIIKKEDNSIDVLSMGMSADYQTAISCGSNMVRLGSAFFGKRTYNA